MQGFSEPVIIHPFEDALGNSQDWAWDFPPWAPPAGLNSIRGSHRSLPAGQGRRKREGKTSEKNGGEAASLLMRFRKDH